MGPGRDRQRASALGAPLLLHEPMTRALRAASKMQIIEGLTDAEIAEAHRSKDVFDEVRDMTAPLDAFLSFIHALDWLDLKSRDDRTALQAFFTGRFGDPVQIAIGKAEPSRKPEGAKPAHELMKRQKPQQEIFSRFIEIFTQACELVAEERFLNWQVSSPACGRIGKAKRSTAGLTRLSAIRLGTG